MVQTDLEMFLPSSCHSPHLLCACAKVFAHAAFAVVALSFRVVQVVLLFPTRCVFIF